MVNFALDVFTAVTSLLLLLLDLESLREQGRIDILAAMAGACCAYWVAARLGPRRTMDRRLAVVTLLVIAVAGWVAIAVAARVPIWRGSPWPALRPMAWT